MRVECEEQTDDWLLQQYLLSRDEEAFGVLVGRYGPMVWGICRRILRHTQDAEDVLQATFAVLSRKASSIRQQRTIGGWLHQVARRIALRARAASIRRGTIMPESVTVAVAEPAVEKGEVDFSEILDDEIARLPTILRLPIILCYLEGLTNVKAAERLGCPEGTVVSRLARAREKLRSRLTRRGVVLGGAAALAVLLTQVGTAATLPPELSNAAVACCRLPQTGSMAGGTILSAGSTRLASETLRSMTLRSLVGSVATTICGTLGITAIVWLILGWSAPPGGLIPNNTLAESSDPVSSIQGIWQGDDFEFIGGDTLAQRAELSNHCRWVIAGSTIRFKWQDETVFSADFQLDLSSRPRGIDILPTDLTTRQTGETLRGAVRVGQSLLQVCTGKPNSDRPGFVRAGVVARPEGDGLEVRTGLVGYSRLRRLFRSYEVEELQGKWVVEHMEAGGDVWELDKQGRQAARFDDNKYTLYHVQGGTVVEMRGTFSLAPDQATQFMEMRPQQGEPFSCLYEVEGDTLRLAAAAPGAPRPEGFKTVPGQPHMSWVFRHAKPSKGEAP